MIKVKMDDQIANAIVKLATANPNEWALMQHYICLKLIKTRDEQETVHSAALGGYCQGLRFLFELYPRAKCTIDKTPWKRDKQIRGEEGFIVNPLIDEDEDENEASDD